MHQAGKRLCILKKFHYHLVACFNKNGGKTRQTDHLISAQQLNIHILKKYKGPKKCLWLMGHDQHKINKLIELLKLKEILKSGHSFFCSGHTFKNLKLSRSIH